MATLPFYLYLSLSFPGGSYTRTPYSTLMVASPCGAGGRGCASPSGGTSSGRWHRLGWQGHQRDTSQLGRQNNYIFMVLLFVAHVAYLFVAHAAFLFVPHAVFFVCGTCCVLCLCHMLYFWFVAHAAFFACGTCCIFCLWHMLYFFIMRGSDTSSLFFKGIGCIFWGANVTQPMLGAH